MSDPRRFARLRPTSPAPAPGFSEVPDGGMCLSVFLVLRPAGDRSRVLMGRLDPRAPWAELGALDPARAAQVGNRWMLPSSQLLLFESPDEAARRVLREQLAGPSLSLEGPAVFSEAYRRSESVTRDPHWDLHFVYRGDWPSSRPPVASPWTELAFVDLASVRPSEIGRAQADVLALVDLAPQGADPAPGLGGPSVSATARTRRR